MANQFLLLDGEKKFGIFGFSYLYIGSVSFGGLKHSLQRDDCKKETNFGFLITNRSRYLIFDILYTLLDEH